MNENLILILNTTLKVTYDNHLSAAFNLDDTKYENKLKNNFIGFYDWLRESENHICGVRLIPFDFAIETISKIPSRSYLKSQSGSVLEIFFKETQNYVEDLSCDQDFGSVIVYLANNSEYAIGFNLENLSVCERQNLYSLFND